MTLPASNEKLVHTVVCESKKDYMDLLFDFSRYGEGRSPYLFRGLSDAEYPLVPSLFRRDFLDACKRNHLELRTRKDIHQSEARLLMDFYFKCDREGLYLPDVPSIRQNAFGNLFSDDTLMDVSRNNEFYWLPSQILELAALAQHYGVKTRLMDWTRDFFVAMWFALQQKGDGQGKDAAIWAIDAESLQDWKHRQEEAVREDSDFKAVRVANESLPDSLAFECVEDTLPLQFIVPPYHGNPNLYAQQGVLSMWRENMIRLAGKEGKGTSLQERMTDAIVEYQRADARDEMVSLDKQLSQYMETVDGTYDCPMDDRPVMMQIILSSNLFEDLRRLMAFSYINRMTLMPGYQGVAEDVNRSAGF